MVPQVVEPHFDTNRIVDGGFDESSVLHRLQAESLRLGLRESRPASITTGVQPVAIQDVRSQARMPGDSLRVLGTYVRGTASFEQMLPRRCWRLARLDVASYSMAYANPSSSGEACDGFDGCGWLLFVDVVRAVGDGAAAHVVCDLPPCGEYVRVRRGA